MGKKVGKKDEKKRGGSKVWRGEEEKEEGQATSIELERERYR